MRILILGGASFTGIGVANYFGQQKNEIIELSRQNVNRQSYYPKEYGNHPIKHIDFDINRDIDSFPGIIEAYKPEYIINFLALGMVNPSWEKPSEWLDTNVVKLSRILEFLKGYKGLKAFVQASTPEVYGAQELSEEPIDENYIYNPSSPYAVSKSAFDLLLRTYCCKYDIPFLITRAANIYGPCQPLYRVIPRLCYSALTGKEFILTGDGKATRSYLHIDDYSRSLDLLIRERTVNEVVHISTSEFLSLNQVIEYVGNVSGANMSQIVRRGEARISEDVAYMMSNKKLRNITGWEPQISLEEGILNILDWLKPRVNKITANELRYRSME